MSAPNLEEERDAYKLRLIEENEKALGEYFINEVREVGGTPIIKDNFESMFDNWTSDLTVMDLEEILEK